MVDFLLQQQNIKQQEQAQENTDKMTKQDVKDLIRKKFSRYSLDVSCKLAQMQQEQDKQSQHLELADKNQTESLESWKKE